MANFDAMVPLIPRDQRMPIDHNEQQWRIRQVERLHDIRQVSDEESNTITNNDAGERQSPERDAQQQPNQGTLSEEESTSATVDDDGHIDTYV